MTVFMTYIDCIVLKISHTVLLSNQQYAVGVSQFTITARLTVLLHVKVKH